MRLRAWIVLGLLLTAVIIFGQLGLEAQKTW